MSVQPSINHWFITGFANAESSFFVSIYRDDKSKLKWRVTPSFSVHIHIKDIALLNMIQQTLGVGASLLQACFDAKGQSMQALMLK